MKKYMIYSSLTSLMICFLFCGANYDNEDKTSELNRKMAEILSLQQSLSQKISLAMQKQEQLNQKVNELEKEIKQEKKQLQKEAKMQSCTEEPTNIRQEWLQHLKAF